MKAAHPSSNKINKTTNTEYYSSLRKPIIPEKTK
jgi:hypothetical protein